MDSNYEWQRRHGQQRIQKYVSDAEQHRLSKQPSVPQNSMSARNILLLPLRVIIAFANRKRSQEARPATIKPRTG